MAPPTGVGERILVLADVCTLPVFQYMPLPSKIGMSLIQEND